MASNHSLGDGFRALFYGSLISNVGDGIRLAALPLLATTLTSSPLLISAVTAAQYLPWITFAPVGGALVDRWRRRRTILITQAWRGLVMAGLAVLVATSHAEIWHVCVLAFAITAGEILVDPSTVALVPTLVDDADLNRANGQISSAEIVANDFAGGPVGATLFSLAPWLPFLIDGATYLGSLVPFRRLPGGHPQRPRGPGPVRAHVTTGRLSAEPPRTPPPQGPPAESRSVRAEAAEGFRWLRDHHILGPLTVSQVVYYFGVATSLSLLVYFVTDELDASDRTFGFVLAIGAVGAFLGTLVGGPVAERIGERITLSGAVVLQAVTLGLSALADSVVVLAVLWFFNGLPAGAQRPVARSLQQRLTPNTLLGRVNVSNRIFTRGIIVIGALLAGTIAQLSGIRASFALAGGVQMLAAALMWRALGRRTSARPTAG